MVIVDTPVWSQFFRRANPEPALHEKLGSLVEQGEAKLLGSVRQEILSGVRDQVQFDRLKVALRAFADIEVTMADHEVAASMFNLCRSHGVQGSHTDFLICAVSAKLDAEIYTLDDDFDAYATRLPIRLYK